MIEEKRLTVGGYETRVLEVAGPRSEHPVIFVHGNPTSADEWRPFLERIDGQRRAVAPDLIGWGKSERRKDLRHTADTLAWFVKEFFKALDVEEFDLVVHDWGSIALISASWWPESVGRIVAINCATFSADYRWHWIGRLWRTPVVGELLNATTTRFGTLQFLRQATPRSGSLPEVADEIHKHLDGGTKRAMLELYRSAPPEKLGELGRFLGNIRAPALIVWGDDDPYTDPRWGDFLGNALGGESHVEHLSGAGHWPWHDRPEVIDMVVDFLLERESTPPPPSAAPPGSGSDEAQA